MARCDNARYAKTNKKDNVIKIGITKNVKEGISENWLISFLLLLMMLLFMRVTRGRWENLIAFQWQHAIYVAKKGGGEIKTNRRDKSENENLHSRKKKSIESNDDEISLWRKVHFCCLVIKNQQHWPSTYKHLHICINGYSYMKKFRVLRGNNSHFLLFTGWENSTREIELLDWERESHTVYDQTDQ